MAFCREQRQVVEIHEVDVGAQHVVERNSASITINAAAMIVEYHDAIFYFAQNLHGHCVVAHDPRGEAAIERWKQEGGGQGVDEVMADLQARLDDAKRRAAQRAGR